MLVFGVVFAILGTVFGLPVMRSRLQISLAEQGNLFLLLYFGIFIASVVVGPLIDHLGNKVNLVTACAAVALAMFLFGAAHSFATAGAAAVLLGVGGGGLNTCTNVLVSDLYVEQRGPMLNLLGIFFGIGALSIPLAAASIEGHFTIPQLFLFCATLSGICGLWYATVLFPAAKTKQAFAWTELLETTKYSGVLLLSFILFCESGNEASIAGWTSTYVGTQGYSPRIATLVLATFWATLMLSRLLAARILRTIGKSQFVTTLALLAVGGCLVLLSARSLTLFFIGTSLLGLAYGPIFPTALAIAGDRYPQRMGTVFGLLFSIALIGGMTFPWAVGQVSERAGVRAGMFVPALGAISILLMSIVISMRERSSNALPSTR